MPYKKNLHLASMDFSKPYLLTSLLLYVFNLLLTFPLKWDTYRRMQEEVGGPTLIFVSPPQNRF